MSVPSLADGQTGAPAPRAFRGAVLHTPVRGAVELLRDAVLIADESGIIQAMHPQGSDAHAAAAAEFGARGDLVNLGWGEYLLPGMIDLHVHAPQWPQLGKALDLPLEEWLLKYTFPLEARYADVDFAAATYTSLVDGMVANGTTCAVYYGTIHLPATQKLADICFERGQRALIGRVAMDHAEQCPDTYRDQPVRALTETRAFIDYVRALAGGAECGAARGAHAPPLVLPVVTPRFIPACTDELLYGLGAIAREKSCHVQTHCSESDWEHGYVLDRCGMSDTLALERFGLLSRHTNLAHGNFVGDDDVAALLRTGSAIAHCPLSNAYFSDAVLPVRRLLDCGVHLGLGTDIAGGPSPSIFDNARQAVIVSRCLESGVDSRLSRLQRHLENSRIDAPTAFWLATAGGGLALDLPIGILSKGYQFDAIVIDPVAPGSNLRIDSADRPEEILQKIVQHASRTNIREVWVGNRCLRQAWKTG
jgi:guanine deaminase